MFRGSSNHTLDPKGRIIIPARFRDVIKASSQDRVMITRMDNCLFGYMIYEWAQFETKILQNPQKSDALRRFQRVFIGSAHDCRCDNQGRVLIPPSLKDYAGLEKDVVLVGALNRFEIWAKDRWEVETGQVETDLEDEQVRQEIAQLGL